MRQHLPERRSNRTITIPDPNPQSSLRYDVTFGPDERDFKEVFVSCHKLTTEMDTAGRDIGKLISIALQHGATPEALAAAMTRGPDGKAQGLAGLVLDAVIAETAVMP